MISVVLCSNSCIGYIVSRLLEGCSMYEFLAQHSLYVVLVIALIVFSGIAYLLMRLERTVTMVEQQLNNHTISSQE